MSIVHSLHWKKRATILLALCVIGSVLLVLPVKAAPTGTSFDHIVILAMENQNYVDVLGDGTSSGCPSGTAPFLCSTLPHSSTIPNYHSYCNSSTDPACSLAGTLGNPPCSAACYTAVTSGNTYGVADGVGAGSVSQTSIFDSLTAAGLSWREFCESGCPRGPDHSPCLQYANTYQSADCIILSGGLIGNSQVLSAFNSSSPPSYIWLTPTDSHNMHDNSISSGDSWVKSLLVGTGSITSPASGSLLATSLFTSTSYHTLLWIWWDEYDPSPNIEYGPMIKQGFISTSNAWDEYSQLKMIENNWALPLLSYDVQASTLTDILGSLSLSASYTYTPLSPTAKIPVAFTGVATGGTPLYSYSWNFGDGATNTGPQAAHTYSSSGSYNVTLTVTDSASHTAKASHIVQVSPVPTLTASFTFSPSQPSSGQLVTFTGSPAGGISPYTYSWNFGDGGTSTSKSPSHAYSSSGTYTVTFNVTDTLGNLATKSQLITVTPPAPLAASFTSIPTPPFSGQTVTFTASTSGGTGSYTYSWNLAGTTKTGNPVSQSFKNGTYTIKLTVTDNAGKTTTSTQSLTVLPPATSGPVPSLVGWGGVGLGEPLSDIQTEMQYLNQSGYNIVRVDFEPTCITPPDGNVLGSYDQAKLAQVIALAKQYKLWIIVDYHGYTELQSSSTEQCWLSFWHSLVQNFTTSYSQIIWEPINEPQMLSSSDVAGLSSAYQAVINEIRAQGDTHWIVVQNLCSSSCSFGDANMAAGYPTINDTAGHIFISLHAYMAYPYYSGAWNNATADTLAQEFYNAVVTGMSTTGWPALNTEGGADPISGNCSGGVALPSSLCAPDQLLVGSSGYSTTTFHFIQALTNLYDGNTPQRINWVWWVEGSWTDTPGAAVYGATQCTATPNGPNGAQEIGWGCLLTFKPLGPPVPGFAVSSSQPSAVTVGQPDSATVTVSMLNGFTGTVTLTDSPPTGLNCGAPSPASIVGSGTSTISCNSSNAGIYTVTITGTSGPAIHLTTATFNFQDFSLSASPSSLSITTGTQTTSTISLNILNGFSSRVTLSLAAPSELSASLGTPTIAGSQSSSLTITPTTAGSYSIVVQGTSGSLTRTLTIPVTVGTQPPPVLSVPSTETVVQTRSLTFTVSATDSAVATPTLTLSASQVPTGATFQPAQGTSPVSSSFSWTPTTSDTPGTYTVSFTVTDGTLSAQTYVVIMVVSSNVLPIITVPGRMNATVGKALAFTVSATDPSGLGGTVTLSSIGLSSNMNFNSSTGIFSFTPTASQAGQTFVISFFATDSNDLMWNNTQSTPIYVQPIASQPPGGGLCLSCLLPKGLTTMAWLLVMGAIIGIISTFGLLHLRASLKLKATRRRIQYLNEQRQTKYRSNPQDNSRRTIQRRRESEGESAGNE